MIHILSRLSAAPSLSSRPVRYVISGGTSAAVNLGVTWTLERAGLFYILVVTLAFVAALLVSFTLQKFFTFGNADRETAHRQFLVFFALALFNLGVNDLLVYVQHDLLSLGHLVAEQALASVVIAVYSFFIYRRIFRATTPS